VEREGRFKREGPYAYLWPIQINVWQKPSQYYNYPLIKNKNYKKLIHLKGKNSGKSYFSMRKGL